MKHRLIAILQLSIAALLIIAALATGAHLISVMLRPETISVVHFMVGQGILIVCLLALARVLLRRGLTRCRNATNPPVC
ncbi:MAG: hypothetical protein ACR2PR_05630 [Pseudohongiellaceae bacterium]